MNKQLKASVYNVLVEALRRYTRFHKDKPLTQAWTGLGFKTDYEQAINGGYMEWANGAPHRGTMGWLVLTASGAKIVKAWLDAGFDYTRVEANDLPPREVK